MRLRILELPMHHLGEASDTPFCLVFDRCPQEDIPAIEANRASLSETVGAVGTLVFATEVDFE